MNGHRGLGLKVATLVVAMLLALGGWQGGVAYAQVAPEGLPHFKCYVITPGTAINVGPVELVDQFGTQLVTVRSAEFVCTPVITKNGTLLLTLPPPFDHLKCHNITPSGPPVNEEHTVTDQFGTEIVTVRTPQFLCAAACKDASCPPTTPEN
jgi:hypothetical protein